MFTAPLPGAPRPLLVSTHLLQILLGLNGARAVVRAVPLALGPANLRSNQVLHTCRQLPRSKGC